MDAHEVERGTEHINMGDVDPHKVECLSPRSCQICELLLTRTMYPAVRQCPARGGGRVELQTT